MHHPCSAGGGAGSPPDDGYFFLIECGAHSFQVVHVVVGANEVFVACCHGGKFRSTRGNRDHVVATDGDAKGEWRIFNEFAGVAAELTIG